MLRVLITVARESVEIAVRFSTRSTFTPYRARVMPVTSPAGPASTIRTSGSFTGFVARPKRGRSSITRATTCKFASSHVLLPIPNIRLDEGSEKCLGPGPVRDAGLFSEMPSKYNAVSRQGLLSFRHAGITSKRATKMTSEMTARDVDTVRQARGSVATRWIAPAHAMAARVDSRRRPHTHDR
jgi:hypothetical protein